MHKTAFEMFSRLPFRSVGPFVNAMMAFSPMLITWGSVYSGTDIAAEALSALRYAWIMLYKVRINMVQKLMCECDPGKIKFLLATNKECDFLCPDAHELTKPMAMNKRTSMKDLVPYIWLLIAGFMWAIPRINQSIRP